MDAETHSRHEKTTLAKSRGANRGARSDAPKRKARKRTRRTRSGHPGVKLKSRALPSGAVRWIARFVDPDLGREVDLTLDATALHTAELRTQWAGQKAKSLARRRMEIEAGGAKIVKQPIKDAIADYFEGAENRLRPRTVKLYKAAAELLKAWAKSEGVETTDELTAAKLPGFRDYLLSKRKQVIVAGKGAKRGSRRATKAKLNPLTINWRLRAVKTLLNDLRLRGVVPRLSRDAIGDALKPAPVPREQPKYLSPGECRALLDAALAHDVAVWNLTRDDKARGLKPGEGKTPKYQPVAPLIAFLLLAGCRIGEAQGLTWDDVNLKAVDHDGKPTGEIRLGAQSTKTGHARTIGLEPSPMLRELLQAMKDNAPKGARFVFGGKAPLARNLIEAARKRLLAGPTPAKPYAAPAFDWQLCRSTCATISCNAPNVFGTAAAFVSAKRLGHSIVVSEKHYAGLFTGIPREAKTLEAAMGIEAEIKRAVDAQKGRA